MKFLSKVYIRPLKFFLVDHSVNFGDIFVAANRTSGDEVVKFAIGVFDNLGIGVSYHHLFHSNLSKLPRAIPSLLLVFSSHYL